MLERCYDKSHAQYRHYGGRGIKVCLEWHTYENFKEWSLQNGYKQELQIGRLDVNGNYEPNNCYYGTAQQLCNNRRTNRFETYRETTDTVINLCRIYNKNYNSVRNKIKRGVSITQAMDSTDKVFVTPDHSDPVKVAKAKKAKAARSALA